MDQHRNKLTLKNRHFQCVKVAKALSSICFFLHIPIKSQNHRHLEYGLVNSQGMFTILTQTPSTSLSASFRKQIEQIVSKISGFESNSFVCFRIYSEISSFSIVNVILNFQPAAQ